MKPPFYQIIITPPAYFRVEQSDGSYVYTLGRRFKIGSTGLLETEENYPFFEHVQLTLPYTNLLNISQTGLVSELNGDILAPIGQLKAVLFQRPDLLENISNGYYLPTQGSGVPVLGNPGDGGEFLNIKTYYEIIFDIQKFYPHVVMKVDIKDYDGVLSLARTVIASLTANSSVYPNPDPALAVIQIQADLLENYIAIVEAGDHSRIGYRDETAVLLYHLLQHQMMYVDFIANGDRAVMMLSGYSIIDEPNPRPIPEQVEIERITDGVEPFTAKIYIKKMSQTSLIYKVQQSLTPDVESSWATVLATKNSHKLIIPNRAHKLEYWYRVNASNANGEGQWSNPVSFISQK